MKFFNPLFASWRLCVPKELSGRTLIQRKDARTQRRKKIIWTLFSIFTCCKMILLLSWAINLDLGTHMARICSLTGKKPSFGRSYALRGIAKKKKGIGLKITGCTNRRFLPNLKTKRVWIPEEKRFVSIRLSTSAIRTMDKKGVSASVRKMRKAGVTI